MPLYKGSRIIKDLYHGNTRIGKLYHGNTLVYQYRYDFPTTQTVPSSYLETEVARVDGANYTIYTVPEDSFYKVEVSGGAGGTAYRNYTIKNAGGTTQIVFLYKGTKCLLWSGSGGGAGDVSGSSAGQTGYPNPGDSLGGTAPNYTSGESGGPGGSASNHGVYGTYQGGHGGGGAGFLAGTDHPVWHYEHNESEWEYPIHTDRDWEAGDYSVDNLYCYILCGGSGGNCSNNGDHRCGGPGGGAYGNSGSNTYSGGVTTGPGGNWGKGENAGRYSAGGDGAWCIMDFSRNQWAWGTGGGVSSSNNGYCSLRKIDAYTLVFESYTPGTYTRDFGAGKFKAEIVGAGGGGAATTLARTHSGSDSHQWANAGQAGGKFITEPFYIQSNQSTTMTIKIGQGGTGGYARAQANYNTASGTTATGGTGGTGHVTGGNGTADPQTGSGFDSDMHTIYCAASTAGGGGGGSSSVSSVAGTFIASGGKGGDAAGNIYLGYIRTIYSNAYGGSAGNGNDDHNELGASGGTASAGGASTTDVSRTGASGNDGYVKIWKSY